MCGDGGARVHGRDRGDRGDHANDHARVHAHAPRPRSRRLP